MKKSIDIFKILFAILIFYILWGISFEFVGNGIDRLLELIIWLFSFIFLYIPIFLFSILVQKHKKPNDTNSTTNEEFEEYAERRIREIREALEQYEK